MAGAGAGGAGDDLASAGHGHGERTDGLEFRHGGAEVAGLGSTSASPSAPATPASWGPQSQAVGATSGHSGTRLDPGGVPTGIVRFESFKVVHDRVLSPQGLSVQVSLTTSVIQLAAAVTVFQVTIAPLSSGYRTVVTVSCET
jgi:hypothetical protein